MIYNALRQHRDRTPDKIALVGENRSLTFAELLREAEKIATHLQNLGIKNEDRVFVGLPPSSEFYTFFFAAAALGATVIPLLPTAKIPTQFLAMNPVVAVGSQAFLESCLNKSPSLRGTIAWSRETGFNIPEPKQPLVRKGIVRNGRIVAVSSSGTTGEPNICFQSAELLLERARLKADALGLTADDVLFSMRPFNNGSSINNHIMVPLVKGCKVVVHERFERFKTAAAIAKNGVTILYGVPFIFELLASIPVDRRVDFSSLRLCISGGGPVSKYVDERFYNRFGIRIRQSYGATQIIPAFTYDVVGVTGAVGQIFGPFPAAVLNEHGRRSKVGQIGEVVFDVARLAPQWKKHFRNHPHRRGKYLYTGDLGRVDRAGNLFVVGRKSSFVKAGGNRVETAEVESVLRSHPQVKEAAVFPLRLGKRDEAVGAIVIPSGNVNRAELTQYCLQRLDPYKCPREIRFARSLPRNANGKITRHNYQLYDGGEAVFPGVGD